MQTHDNDTSAFAADLRSLLAGEFGDDSLEVHALDRRGEGYSWETYIVDVRSRQSADVVPSRFAVKREPRAGLLGIYDVQREVDLLRAAGEIGCPAPRVVAFRLGSSDCRGFYAMEMIDGVVPMPWNVRKMIPDAQIRRTLGLELAAIMGRLHRANLDRIRVHDLDPPSAPGETGAAELRKWRDVYLACTPRRIPIVDLAFAWLDHRSDRVSGRVCLVHNDLRVGNVIVRDGRVAAVLDWETADLTDPAADLAKFNLPTFRGRSSNASGLIDWNEFLDAYAAVAQWRPDPHTIDYWTVLEIVKAIVGSLRGVHFFRRRRTDDLRYLNMGWQTHHSIKWLVELYESGRWGR